MHRERSSQLRLVLLASRSSWRLIAPPFAARFLFDMLADLNTWYKTEALYKLEAISSQTHGFVEFDQTTTSPEAAYITWDKYKILMQMWQRRMVQVRLSSSSAIDLANPSPRRPSASAWNLANTCTSKTRSSS